MGSGLSCFGVVFLWESLAWYFATPPQMFLLFSMPLIVWISNQPHEHPSPPPLYTYAYAYNSNDNRYGIPP